MSVLVLVVVPFTLVLLTKGSSFLNLFHVGPGTFINELGGYSIDYPSGWIALEFENGNHGDKETTGMLVMRNQDSPNLTIRQFETQNPNLDEAVLWGKNRVITRYDEYGTFLFDSPEYKIVNYLPMATRTYTLSFYETGNSLKNIDAYVVSEGTIFILTFSSVSAEFEQNTPVFDEMLQSFVIE